MRKYMLYGLLALGIGACQTRPIKVKGTVKWNDSMITGYPEKLEISSLEDTAFHMQVAVDTVGKYELSLPIGRYQISPEKHYHWIEEEWIRIDEKRSVVQLEVVKSEKLIAPLLELDTLPWPTITSLEGVLHDFDETKAAFLDDFIQTHLAFFEVPGASLALVKEGRIIYHQAYGVQNALTQEAVYQNTLFEAGSITKLTFAFLVMRLVEKGILDLDEPLYALLPFEAVAHDERYKLITARHVLSHQTGFPNWAKRDEHGEFALKFTPGTRYGYSGEGIEYLKRVIEKVSQQSIDTLIITELIEPLNLPPLHFKGSKTVEQFSANGHHNLKPNTVRLLEKPMMAYSLAIDASTLAIFVLALMEQKGLSEASYKELYRIHSSREDGVHWGLGIRIEETPLGTVYGHSGSTSRGFIGNVSFSTELDMGYVFLTNSHMGGWLSIPLLTEVLMTGKVEKE